MALLSSIKTSSGLLLGYGPLPLLAPTTELRFIWKVNAARSASSSTFMSSSEPASGESPSDSFEINGSPYFSVSDFYCAKMLFLNGLSPVLICGF